MSLEGMRFLVYGLFGEKLINSLDPDTWMTLIPFGIIVVVTVVAVKYMSFLKGKKQYLGILLTIAVYICLIGGICAAGMLILWLILRMLAGSNEEYIRKQSSRSEKEAADRNAEEDAAYQRLYCFALRLDSCLTEDKKSEFISDASYVIHSSSATPEDYDAVIDCWKHYLYDPMPGSRNRPER